MNHHFTIRHAFDFALTSRGNFSYRCCIDGQWQEATRHQFVVDDMVMSRLSARPLGALEADLRDVTLSLHLADRLAPRKPKGKRDHSGLWWHRHIKVRLGVRCVERWNERAVREELNTYLHFNTGDTWELEFVPLQAPRSGIEDQQLLGALVEERHETLRRRFPNLVVALFSGGADSLAGLAHQLEQKPGARFVLVSVDSSSTVRNRQRDLLARIPSEFLPRIEHVPIELNLKAAKDGVLTRSGQEMSLRTRGLLFLSAGAIVARLMGRQQLCVYENGWGALNLSFDRSQLPGQTTRAVHPRSLALFGRFLTALFRQPFSIENPYQFETKGELCRALDHPNWRPLITQSFTCGHPQRKKDEGIWHCGICTSCILRRVGFRVAGLSWDDTSRYLYDLSRPHEVPAAKREEWIAAQFQLHRVERALRGITDEEAAWQSVTREFPELIPTALDMAATQPLSAPEVRRGLLRLLRTTVSDGLQLMPAPIAVLEHEETQRAADVMISFPRSA